MDDATEKPAPGPTPEGEYTNPGIRWDSQTIQSEALHFPPEMREGYVWLKSYVRDEHNREVIGLVEISQRLGINHDKTTWSRILRGRWNRSAHGDPLPSPIVAADKLKRAIEEIRRAVQAEASRGKVPFVMTSVAQNIFDFVDAKRALNRVNRFGIIVGATGSGKTATAKEYARLRNHGTTSWFEAPAGGSLAEFVRRMGVHMGLSPQTNMAKQKAHLLRATLENKCWWIDNAQDLYRPGKGDLAAFTFLRQLQDETNCTIILSITPTFEAELVRGMLSSYWEQFVGRSGGTRKWLRLPEWPPDEDVLAIAQAFGLRDATRHLKRLVALSRQPGRIRVLFDDLQDAKRLAVLRKEALTIDILEEVQES